MILKSNEELNMLLWLNELEAANVISNIQYEPESFQLTKQLVVQVKNSRTGKIESVPIIGIKTYTPDFRFHVDKPELFWTLSGNNTSNQVPLILSHKYMCYVDVKGENKGVSSGPIQSRNSDLTFPDRQAMMYNTHGIVVNEVLTHTTNLKKDNAAKKLSNKSLFRRTFCPQKFIENQVYKIGPKKGESKIQYPIVTIDEYLQTLK